jgi:hypothetical protein
MRKLVMAVLVAGVVLSCGYVAYAIHETPVEGTKVTEPSGPDAGKLYRMMTMPKRYDQRFNVWPGKKKLVAGSEPHGAFTTTYVNDKAFSSLKKKGAMADGACIIMENYTADKKLESLTVMFKIDGYNPEAGDWFWAKYDAKNGYPLESGKVDACLGCHSQKKDSDYLHATEAKK